ncbi:hypothetical protein ACHAXR_006898 [Thalassiosira sp. AJA248-18]
MRRSLLLSAILFAGTASAFSAVVDITRSYTLQGDGIASDNNCILHEVRPAPRDPTMGEDDGTTTRRAFMIPNHAVLNIAQTSYGCGDLGASVWPSAIALASLLASDSTFIEGKRCIELGSGCGLPSLVAKEVCHAHSILATDYWEVAGKVDDDGHQLLSSGNGGDDDRQVPKDLFGVNLAYNIGSLGSSTTGSTTASSIGMLDWHDESGIFKIANEFRPDVIIGSDLVYYPKDTTPLLQTLESLLKTGGGPKEALLISPLPPKAAHWSPSIRRASGKREALPDFRAQLENGVLGDGYEVIMDEMEMIGTGRDGGDEEIHNFLRIQIRST